MHEQALNLAGIIGHQSCCRRFVLAGKPDMPQNVQLKACTTLCDALKHSQHTLAASAAAALGHAGLRGPLPLPLGVDTSDSITAPASSAALKADATPAGPDAKRAKSPSDDKQNLQPATTAAAAPASTTTAAQTISGVTLPEHKKQEEAQVSMQQAMKLIVTLMKDKDVKVAQRAATAAGHLCAGQPVRAVMDPALEGLFALGFNKNEDVLFTVGEALCFAFGGRLFSPVAFAMNHSLESQLHRICHKFEFVTYAVLWSPFSQILYSPT